MNSALLKQLRQFAASRHNQRKAEFFVIEGIRCGGEALARRPRWLTAVILSETVAESPETREIVAAARQAGVEPEWIPDSLFSQLAMTEGPQGVLCVMRKPQPTVPDRLDQTCTLILDQVREPGNVGTILRTAWSIGLTQVWFTNGSADPWSPKVVRSGMGAQFAIEVQHFPDLATAVQTFHNLGGQQVWCAMMNARTTLFSQDFTPTGAAIVLGNEGHGISCPELGEAVTIPMPGQAESLNVAQAATLLMYEALRRKINNQLITNIL